MFRMFVLSSWFLRCRIWLLIDGFVCGLFWIGFVVCSVRYFVVLFVLRNLVSGVCMMW